MEFSAMPIVALALGSAFCLIQCPVILGLARSFGWYDPTGPRKLHAEPVPRLGGIAIFGAFAMALLLLTLRGEHPLGVVHGAIPLWPVVLGAFLIHIMGVLDDFQNLKATDKLLVEFIAALCLVAGGFRFQGCQVPWSDTPLAFGVLSYPLSVLWIVGVTNAMNLLDGMDGLAATVGVLASCTFGILFLVKGNGPGAAIAFALCGSLLGFLWFNWHPARLFMGDGGSLLVGFVLAALPLISHADGTIEIGFITSVVVLGLPILDTLHVILERKMSGRPLMKGDMEHLHHHLLRLGFGPKASLLLLAGSALLLCLTALTANLMGPTLGFFAKVSPLAFLAVCIRLIHMLALRRERVPVLIQKR